MQQPDISRKMKEQIASARKKAAVARGIYNRSFVSAEDALPSLLVSLHSLKRTVDDAGGVELSALESLLNAEISRIALFHEKYLQGEPSEFSRKDLAKTIATICRISSMLEKYRIRRWAGRRERILYKSIHALIIAAFVLLFAVLGVGLAVGLSHPGYDQGLTGNYFTNPDFGGHRFQTIDHQIVFNWGITSPMKGIPDNQFSVRWEGCLRVEAKNGMFIAAGADDGIRVIIDGETVVDSWRSRDYAPKLLERRIGPGVHPIEVQYREEGGSAHVFLGWTHGGKRPVAVPARNLIPRNLVLGAQGSNPDCPAMPPLKPQGKQAR